MAEFLQISEHLLNEAQYFYNTVTDFTNKSAELLERGMIEEFHENEIRSVYYRNAFFRSFYALVEGNLYNLKYIASCLKLRPGVNFSDGDLYMMQEISYEIKDDGRVRQVNTKMRLKNNFRFSLDVFIRATGIPITIDYSSLGWPAFISCIGVRDRLMHPKIHQDVLVTHDDMMKVSIAYVWFANIMRDILQQLSERMEVLQPYIEAS